MEEFQLINVDGVRGIENPYYCIIVKTAPGSIFQQMLK